MIFVYRELMILGYLDKSEKNISVTEQRQQIIQYASKNNLIIDMFWEDKDVSVLSEKLNTNNHTIVIANIVALGTTLATIKDNIRLFATAGIKVVSVKEGLCLNFEHISEIIKGFELALDIRNSLSSIVTCKALAERKASGVVLGRKTPNRTHVFDNKGEYVKQQLAKGVTKVQIAKDLGVSQGYLYAFLKAHPELKGAKNA